MRFNVSAALVRSGVDMSRYSGTRSWQEGKPKYAIRAEELAHWLATGAAHLPARLTKYAGKAVAGAFDKMDGKAGLIFLKDYYGPGLSGDHIDLFNGSRMTDWSSWIRIQTGFSIPEYWSDYRKAAAIWFWQLA